MVRLANGSTEYEGRVEVYNNSQWHSVCDNGWDLNDAQVVCRELDFGPAIAARKQAYYGQGRGQWWIEDLNCTGTELTIMDCSHRWIFEGCNHSQDAGVKCDVPNGNFSYKVFITLF